MKRKTSIRSIIIATVAASFLSACSMANSKPNQDKKTEAITPQQVFKTDKPFFSGVYPHLAMWNSEGECGTGAVVPWAGKLWAVTYGPHCVFKSDDKLYEFDQNLNKTIRKESLGGTHANRLIHKESNQLIIGEYFIDAKANVRAIPRDIMPGRLTGNARHLTDPANKVYFATMEEALYEVDVNSLEVKEIIRDGNLKPHSKKFDKNGNLIAQPQISKLHGYHGKGFYSGFNKLFYSNNGVHHPLVSKDPTLKSGALASWSVGDKDWSPIRINQFTEITGPGGIYGNPNPDKDPIWSLGFDAKSVILMLNDGGKWTPLRLPKASHSYDGSHGWNTEWPRIRDIGEKDFLMTMHGAFWSFPPTFNAKNMQGIRMRSNYLKVIGDFCEWKGLLVLGCDDSAQKEFFNTRSLKSENVSPAQSNSNLVFMSKDEIDQRGPIIGRGSVFLREDVSAKSPSEPMLVGGFQKVILVLDHKSTNEIDVTIEVSDGNGEFEKYKTVSLDANSSKFIDLSGNDFEWVRIVPQENAEKFTAIFNLSTPDARSTVSSKIFEPISQIGEKQSVAALLWGMGDNSRKLGAVAFQENIDGKVQQIGTYSMDWQTILQSDNSQKLTKRIKSTEFKPQGISFENDTVLIVEDGKRYRLPRNQKYTLENVFGYPRLAREVATERDLFNCAGTFYELPAKNAQGMAKIRPIATHNLNIFDFASYRGLMLLAGLKPEALNGENPHVILSKDKKFALWAGIIDDLWKLGKPVGVGSPWFNEKIAANQVSDPYLLTGYDKKSIKVNSTNDTSIIVEIDIDGTGLWVDYETLEIKAGKEFFKEFDESMVGYWVRFKASASADSITTTLIYQ